jgi:ribulose-phosphate 3-epimerase
MKHFLAPSVLSADFGILKEQIEIINQSAADFIHIDVMDGVFVPNISFGFPVVETIAKYATKPLDIHLMIVDPDKFIERFCAYKPEYLTLHFEACPHLNRSLSHIRSLGVKAGVALNPHTAVSQLEEIIAIADMVLIMSVNPGYGGQKFIHNSLQKISKTREMIRKSASKALIEVDGGIGLNNIKEVVEAGADIVVAGNAVFGQPDIKAAIEKLKSSEFSI